MVRVGIIGGGFGARVHAPAFRRDSRTQVRGIWTRSLKKSRALARANKIPVVYRTWRAMLRDPNIDAVSVALPASVQARVAAEALKLGKPLFLEKPLSANVDTARRLSRLQKQKRTPVAMDFQFPELDIWKSVKDEVDRKALGRLRVVNVHWILPTLPTERKSSWKEDPRQGGGLLHFYGSDVFHYLNWLFGRVKKISARMRGPDDIRMGLETRAGFPISVYLLRAREDNQIHTVSIIGTKKSLHLENSTEDYMNGFTLTESRFKKRPRRLRREKGERGEKDGRVAAVASLWTRFVDSVLRRKAMRPTLEDGLRVEELAAAAFKSHRLRRWIRL